MSFGLQIENIAQATAGLKETARFPIEPRQLGNLWYAFAEDPNRQSDRAIRRNCELAGRRGRDRQGNAFHILFITAISRVVTNLLNPGCRMAYDPSQWRG
jgi:hypothetical protein